MNKNEYFHPNHHGFRAGHSTSTAMIQMYVSWVQAVDKGELAGVCMLDMSAASELKKTGSTGSTLPEHTRISPGTPMTRTNANGVSTMVPYFSSLGSYLNGSI